MNWLLNRLKERTTWLAIFTLAGLVGIKLEPELRELIINAILGVAAVVAFVFRENIRERSTDLDQASRPAPALPPIELQSRSEYPGMRDVDSANQPNPVDSDLPVFDGEDAHRVRRTGLPPDPFIESHEQSVRSGQDGYNG